MKLSNCVVVDMTLDLSNVTPDLNNMILDLSNIIKVESIAVCLVKNALYLAVNNKLCLASEYPDTIKER